jgi:hypothetical protein
MGASDAAESSGKCRLGLSREIRRSDWPETLGEETLARTQLQSDFGVPKTPLPDTDGPVRWLGMTARPVRSHRAIERPDRSPNCRTDPAVVGACRRISKYFISRCPPNFSNQHYWKLAAVREKAPKKRSNGLADGALGVTKPRCEACSRPCSPVPGVISAPGKIESVESPVSAGRSEESGGPLAA